MAPSKAKKPSDMDPRSRADSSPEVSDSRSTSGRSKAGIRVSLACVQCRSKHQKCDATQPACRRCTAEGKLCYYAKSRRGIRDVKKQGSSSDVPLIPSLPHATPASGSASGLFPFNASNNLRSGWAVPRSADANTDEGLIDAFFDNFYSGHPILPPKKHLLQYTESDRNTYHFLLAVMNFCGALHTRSPRLHELREEAYCAANGPLPVTVQSVQGLYLLAVVAFGESKLSHHIGFGDRSLSMAIELGMHRKAFADRFIDPVWAESCRRTWWYVKFQGMIRHISGVGPTNDIYDIESDTDIPCSEEWEYQSGEIPLPMSRLEYQRAINLGRSDFSSLALQIEICHMQNDITDLCNEDIHIDDVREQRINEADAKICDFLRRIPRWKMDVVDPSGRPDQILFDAVAWAHISRIRLRQSALRKGLNLREYFPLGPNTGPSHKGQGVKRFGWNPHSVDIQAADSVCDMFRYPFPVRSLRPTMIPGLIRVAIVYLDACVFLGLDSPVFRERINSLIRIIKIHGETWPISKKIAEDIQRVVDDYVDPKDGELGPNLNQMNPTGAGALSAAPIFGSSTAQFDLCSFPHPELEYISLNYCEFDQAMFPPFLIDGIGQATSDL
ncbi:hypothetical protein F5Y14DRAFT_28448 [Nemania sp. NC0429]|nr:hypothetical protein F5Y14DRAFT_28448 [Nemania sp. NC0429]